MVGIRSVLAAAASLLSLAFAQDTSTNSPQRQLMLSNCADDSGFKTCQANADKALDQCIQGAKSRGSSQVEILACGCTYYTQNINCAATSCWNKVNECNYQIFITGFLANCPTAKAPIPYFGFDKDAQDACSCNLAQINVETSAAVVYSGECSNKANGPDAGSNVQQIQGCMCCAVSASLSTIVNNCPKTNPNLVGLDGDKQLQTTLNANWNDCAKYLASYDCINGLGFPKLANGDYRTPSTLGNFGSDPLTNTGGTVTKPALGEKFSWTNAADGITYNIVAQGLGKASSSGSSSSGSSGSSSSGSSSGSSSASPSGSSGSSGDSKKNGASGVVLSTMGVTVPVIMMLLGTA